MKHKRIYIILCITFSICFFSRCLQSADNGAEDIRGTDYAGAATCISCHKDIHNSYQHTGHYKTSQQVQDSYMQQLTRNLSNSFSFPGNSSVVIEKTGTGFYQSSYHAGQKSESHRFDLAFGSGAKAQTFAYWKDSSLFQLPLTYFAAIPGWANSPGFPADRIYYERNIIKGCFECHSSYIESESKEAGGLSVRDVYNKNAIIYGIDCERCHGPAAAHVSFHTQNPGEKVPKFITSWSKLTRQQQLDACAVCHSGNDLDKQRTIFAFKPGDTLSDFYFPAFASSRKEPDVHGKQMQLLSASACFISSASLTCVSCHNTHKNETNDLALQVQHCRNCHSNPQHPPIDGKEIGGNAITENCMDCHMPEMASKKISFQKAGEDKVTGYLLRTHRIAVYPEATDKILDKIRKGPGKK